MPAIQDAAVVALYLFDVAETIDLQAIPALIGSSGVQARLAPKPATPAYVQYDKPPLSFEAEAIGLPPIDGFATRFRLYDYGVVSVSLTRPFAGSWSDLLNDGQQLMENPQLEQRIEELCRSAVARISKAIVGARHQFLTEDYLVYALYELDERVTADELIGDRGEDIAAMLRGERQPLSEQEKTAVLRHRLSYLADDVIVPTWNAALVYDTPSGAQAALDILEFANSQLLEYRYYDELLDAELAAIYSRLQRPRWYEQWIGSRYTRAARHVHSLIIDLNELTDRTENTLKFIGDVYAARLFALVADRLGLTTWKANVQEKLKTLDDIYRFAVEQSSMSRGQFLELTVVLILVLELILILRGVMR
jgi:hypothetical protein